MKKDIRLIIFLCSFLILVWKSNSYYSNVLEKNWGIVIPEFSSYEEIYEKEGEPSFFGDGVRYHVFSYRRDSYIESWFRWEEKEYKTRHFLNYSDAVKKWLEEIEVEEEFYPDFEKCLYYYDKDGMDEIIILWDESKKKFYVVESFM